MIYLIYQQTNIDGVPHYRIARPDARLDPLTGQYPTVEAATQRLVDARVEYRLVTDDGGIDVRRDYEI